MKSKSFRGWSMLIVSNFIFAGAYVSGKIALASVSPIVLNTLRFIVASTLLVPILIAQRKYLRMNRRDLLIFITVSLCSFVLNKFFEYWGLSLSNASDTALLISGEGVFTAILAWVILKEQITFGRVAALLIGLFGAYLIIERGLVPHFQESGSTSLRIIGDGLFLLSLVFEAFSSIISKKLTGKFSPLFITSATVTGSLFVWIPAGSVDIALHGLKLTWPAAAGILYLGVLVTATAYYLWFGGLQIISAASAAVTLFLQPLIGALLAVFILGDQIGLFTLIGGICIIVSMWMISWPVPNKKELEIGLNVAVSDLDTFRGV